MKLRSKLTDCLEFSHCKNVSVKKLTPCKSDHFAKMSPCKSVLVQKRHQPTFARGTL